MVVRVQVCLCIVMLSLMTGSCYVTKQAIYQNDLMNRRELIDHLLKDESLDPDLKQSFLSLGRILQFAKTNGLNSDEAYEYYIDTPQPVVSYLVVASEPLVLKRKYWWFPLIGDVPYLGFFQKSDRDREANILREQGLDVHETAASAFSSLGWFADPLYKSMVYKRSENDFAHLIFHELTHRTVWIPNDSSFNEGLAEFVADLLLDKYLENHRINRGKLDAERRDDAYFANWVENLKGELAKLYESSLDPKEKLAKKAEIFGDFLEGKWPSFETNSYENLRKRSWNNAMLLGISLYTNEKNEAARLYTQYQKPSVSEFLSRIERERK